MSRAREPRRPALPGPVREAVDFYRAHPIVLAIMLMVGGGLAAAVLVDGGVGLGEAIAVIAAGALLGVLWAALAALRRS